MEHAASGNIRLTMTVRSPDRKGEAWAAAWERGRAAWPGVDLPREAFAAHLSTLFPPPSGEDDAADSHVADLYLACACGHGIPAAIRALEREHLQHVPRFIGKTSSDPVLADEVLQSVRSKLLLRDGGPPKILEYAGKGSLGAWIRVTAIRAAQTMLRRRGPRVEPAEPAALADVLEASADGELSVLRAKLGPKVTEAVQESMRSLSAEQRNLLRLHYFDGLSFDRIGAMFKVNRATACRWVAEARRAIVEGTRRRLRDDLRLHESELDAVTRLVRSQLDVSMSSILAGR